MSTQILTRYSAIVILSLLSLACFAQEKLDFNVVSFGIDQFSTTAQDKRYEKYDGNGDRYAIIKVKDAQGEGGLEGFTFNFGSLNSIVESHDDELWVYVQRNAKTVTIKRPGYKTIERFDLSTTTQPGKTYIMTLTMSRVRKEIVHDITKQVLQFVVTPSHENAFVKVKNVSVDSDYEPWGAVDETGSIDKMLDFGTYDYVITAQDYVQSSGRVVLSDSKNNYVEKVILKPNFGFLSVTDTYGIAGAQIYVDEQMIGTIPYKDTNKRWTCGSHSLTITNGDLYKPYKTTFVIEQGDTTILSPKLESDFAETTINVDADADILIDGKYKGKKTWTGPLKAGRYVVECRQAGHRSTSMSINVEADKADTFEAPAPVPIYGSLYVRSNPSGASIEIDGTDHGLTPKLIQNQIIGDHVVKMTMKNHKTEEIAINIKEGETENVDVVLSDVAQMTIDSKPSGSKLIINGESMGTTPFSKEMSSGDYSIEVRRKRYRTFKEIVHLDSSTPSKTITLKRQYLRPYSFYVQPYMQMGGRLAAGGAVGGYIANVNVEAFYDKGLKESEMIYWNFVESESLPCGYTYAASSFGGRLGYGIILGTRMRLTPRVGMGAVNLESVKSYREPPTFSASRAYAVTATVGTKLEFAFLTCMGVFVEPEYSFAVKKTGYYADMEPISSTIKGFASGFNVRAGLSLFF